MTFMSFSQDGKFNFGARDLGIGGASITLGDKYSLFNNIGGIARLEEHSLFGSYQNKYGIAEFQVVGVGAIYHSTLGNAGVGFYKFGNDLFSQQRVHVVVGNQFQMVSLGIGIDLLQYSISTVGTQHAFALQFGGIVEITPQFYFGAHIFNLNQVKLVKETNEKVPTVMKGGISYRSSSELMINLEVEKDLYFAEIIKVGLEYQIIENVYLRTGISSEPFLGAFGLGFSSGKIQSDYAYANDSRLGAIHEFSISYSFKK